MKISKNLSLSEMLKSGTARRKGIENIPTEEHIENMKVLAEKIFQPIREHFAFLLVLAVVIVQKVSTKP